MTQHIVWVLCINSPNGMLFDAAEEPAILERLVLKYALKHWDDAGIEQAMPADDDALVDAYFQHSGDSYDIAVVQVRTEEGTP